MAATAGAARVAVLMVALLAAQASAHFVQFGLLGALKADKLLLSKASAFDHETPKQWAVSDLVSMQGSEAWLAFFTVNPGDSALEVDRDGHTATIPLSQETDASKRSTDAVEITMIEVGGDPMALIQVPGHFKDVWRTFHEKSQAIITGESAKPKDEWEEALTAAWKSAWSFWNTDRVYMILFAQGLGEVDTRKSLEILMKGQDGEQSSFRTTSEVAAWLATSVPRSGAGSASFLVRADSKETEEKKLEDTPSHHSARCTMLKSKDAAGNLEVFVAAFSNKETSDDFREKAVSEMKHLWISQSATWLFDEIAAMCSDLHKLDGDVLGGTDRNVAGREDLFPNPVQASDSRASSVAEEVVGTYLMLIFGSCGVASVVLLGVVWWFCRGGGADNKSDDVSSGIAAPDIHGDTWDMDGAGGGFGGGGVGLWARERADGAR